MRRRFLFAFSLLSVTCSSAFLPAQEKSVRPGINDSFRDPNVKEYVERFEVESREVFNRRVEIVKACDIKPGQTVADIGAGTGIFTRLFSTAVGKEGHVIAVDISQNFLDHIQSVAREQGQANIDTLLCSADSTKLPADTVDIAYICDTYHHFEFPFKTMDSLFAAMKPGGRVVLVDFKRVEGESSDWTLNHVRAGQEVFEAEVLKSGFKKVGENKEILKDNYFVIFEKPAAAAADSQTQLQLRRTTLVAQPVQRGGGPPADVRADQDVFHYLLENHKKIRRSVKLTDSGVDTLTESDSPEVAAKIKEHVASMHKRVVDGRGLRFWDQLFATIFKHHAKIEMSYEETEKGVKVSESSSDPMVAGLIKAHAEVVSLFVKNGFDEAEKNHAVPLPPVVKTELVFPIVEGIGGVLPRPMAVEQPQVGAKVIFDVTNDTKANEINKGLDRVARLLNLYGSAGLKASDVKISLVLHGESTKTALSDAAYHQRFSVETNPNLPLIRKLQELGVEIYVCGQALNYKSFADSEVADNIPIAAAALTVVTNKQAAGFSYVPVQ